MRLRDIFKSKAVKSVVLTLAAGATLLTGMAGSAEARGFDLGRIGDRAARSLENEVGNSARRAIRGVFRAHERAQREQERMERKAIRQMEKHQEAVERADKKAADVFNKCVQRGQRSVGECREAATTYRMITGGQYPAP